MRPASFSVGHWACNIGCSIYFLWAGFRHLQSVEGQFISVEGAIALGCVCLAAIILTRAPATDFLHTPVVVAAVGYAKMHYLLVDLSTPASHELLLVGSAFYIAGALAWLTSAVTLGRSFSILPALRRVRTAGPYALVRHPMYASYMLLDLGLLASFPSPRNALVLIAAAASYVVRARFEESILQRDAGYRTYMERMRYRFLPGLY